MPKSKKEWKRISGTFGLAWDGDIEKAKAERNQIMGRKGYKLHEVIRSGKLPSGQERITFVYVR